MEYLKQLFYKDKKRKAYFIPAAVLISILLIAFLIAFHLSGRIIIDGEKFTYTQLSSKTLTLQDRAGNEMVYTLLAVAESISYKDMRISYTLKLPSAEYSYIYTFSDKSTASVGVADFLGDDSFYSSLTELQRREYDLFEHLRSYKEKVERRRMFPLLFAVEVVIVFISLLGIIYPKKMWRYRMRHDVIGGKPTDWALSVEFWSAIILLILPIVFISIYMFTTL